MNRRAFLRALGLGGAALALAPYLPVARAAALPVPIPMLAVNEVIVWGDEAFVFEVCRIGNPFPILRFALAKDGMYHWQAAAPDCRILMPPGDRLTITGPPHRADIGWVRA